MGLSIADSILSMIDNFLHLIGGLSKAVKDALTYVTEIVNTLVSLVRLAHNYYAASLQSQQNRALVRRAQSLGIAYTQKFSWSTCRALISIDHAVGKQHDMFKKYMRFLKMQGVAQITPTAMKTAMVNVLEEVCPSFAVGCSLIIDGNLPAEVRSSIPASLVARIRNRVLYGPISDIAVAMNSEQARALLSIGYQQIGQYMFICRSCSGSVIMDMSLTGGIKKISDVFDLTVKELKREKVNGYSVHIQMLRKVFGNGERQLKFVQIPLSELHKTTQHVLVDIASDFMQIPYHLTKYKAFLDFWGEGTIDKVKDSNGEFSKIYKLIDYTPMGHGIVDDRSLIEAFDGQCLADEKKHESGERDFTKVSCDGGSGL